MITYLSGKIFEISPSSVVVDCNGVGYLAIISLQTYTEIQKKENILLYVQEIIREDAYLLYGFSTKIERELFNLLISVNGVGPASAVMMLSSMSVQEISSAIASGDNLTLQKIKGIGAKTSQRIILDLKDKLITFSISDEISQNIGNKNKNEALTALEVLGISKKVTEKIIDRILKENSDIEVGNLIKETLKKL